MHMHKCILAKTHPPQWVTLWSGFWNFNRKMKLFMTQSTRYNRYKLLPVCISMSKSKGRQDWGPPTTSPRDISCKERYELPGSNAVKIHCYCVSFSIHIMLVIKSLACSMMKVPRHWKTNLTKAGMQKSKPLRSSIILSSIHSSLLTHFLHLFAKHTHTQYDSTFNSCVAAMTCNQFC